MDDPSFVSSTPSAAKMNHLLPADVSVIPNAGNEGKDKRRPSSKELFGPSITLTQHEEPSLRRETYVAQTLAPVNIQSPQLVKLTDVEVSNMLNFSDSPAGSSILINDSQRIVGEIDNVTKNVVKAEHQHEEVEVEDASLLVKNYMENSDKERSSAMVSTLTNSQKTNSTGEVTAIQTVVTSPSGEKTELVQKAISYQGKSSQDEQKYDKLFTPPSTHLVPSCTNSGDSYLDPPMVTNFGTGSTAHPDLRRDTFIKCDPSHVISTPSGAKMRDTPPIEPYTDTTDIHVHHQRPSSDELFGPAVHGEPILHQETYVAQTLTPVVEEEVDNASLLVKHYMENSGKECPIVKDIEIVEHQEKEIMSASRETYIVGHQRSEDSEHNISEDINVSTNVREAAEKIGTELPEVKNTSYVVENYLEKSDKESLSIRDLVDASEKGRMSTSRETYTVEDGMRKDSEQILIDGPGIMPVEQDQLHRVTYVAQALAPVEEEDMSTSRETYTVEDVTSTANNKVVTEATSEAEKTRNAFVIDNKEIKNTVAAETEAMYNTGKEVAKIKPSKSVSDKEKKPRSWTIDTRVVEKYNGTAAVPAALTGTKPKKVAASNVRQSVGGIGLLKGNVKAKRISAGPQQRLTLIKPMRGTMTGKVASHPNPFASRNIYYDERWVQKQESGFMKW